MAQTAVTSYFTTRKRSARDDISQIHKKVSIIDNEGETNALNKIKLIEKEQIINDEIKNHILSGQNDSKRKILTKSTKRGTRSRSSSRKQIQRPDANNSKQEKIVKFIKMGMLSPKTHLMSPIKQSKEEINMESIPETDRGFETPTKKKTDLNIEEIKTKITKSNRLDQIRASIAKINEFDSKLKKISKSTAPPSKDSPAKKLKEFETIEVEILSPSKRLSSHLELLEKTPTKLGDNPLMSPRKLTPQKLLFSPTKGSPIKAPAYQRFQNLTDIGKSGLQLPFKYRYLLEMFRCCESVCAMFYNRKEIITFKKLKPAIQRMSRKNFTEDHLAQIFHLFPGSYKFDQVKMRNYGSLSKTDTYQLVIRPNIEEKSATITSAVIDEDNLIKLGENSIMNSQVLMERLKKFHNILVELVKDEHEKFLTTLNQPITLPRDKIKRWHPEFDLERCPEIPKGDLPKPPTEEKFSSAKDILSTARNLFNCATPTERMMQKYAETMNNSSTNEMISPSTSLNENETLLKGVPSSLLAKIRAKQTARAMAAMTRRPSQDIEATKYLRLSDLTKHIRNVFVTEKKSVLPMEIVLEKLKNSYRGILTNAEFEDHMKLIEKECPSFISFPIIRNTKYVKILKDKDINSVMEKLEKIAQEKSQ